MILDRRAIAGTFAGAGALFLIFQGHVTEGAVILASMVGFFVGDVNGRKSRSD